MGVSSMFYNSYGTLPTEYTCVHVYVMMQVTRLFEFFFFPASWIWSDDRTELFSLN